MAEVKELYETLLKRGYTAKDAAKEAQARTGHSLVTQRPIKQRGPKHPLKTKYMYGESDG